MNKRPEKPVETDESVAESGLHPSSFILHPSSRDRRWAIRVAIAAMALTMVPYLFGWSLRGVRPALGWFSWLGYNLDDGCVYLSWMRQAADGHFFIRDLFTTAPQSGHQYYVFFWALGTAARLLHLPLLFVWHAARILLGVAFLRAVWWLLELLVADSRARRAAFLLVVFSAGLGWLPGVWRAEGHDAPVDVWQPEAITFLSLYLNPLFIVSQLLMVGIIGWLLIAERRRSIRAALYAGVCGLLLGNIHAYDVITVSLIWASFLVVRSILQRRIDARSWGRAILAGLVAAPPTAYLFYLARTERVFAQRIAVETLSPPFAQYLLGYGLVLLLAVVGVCVLVTGRRAASGGGNQGEMEQSEREGLSDRQTISPFPTFRTDSATLIIVWAVANLAAAYLPVSFQRKMVMGEHLPLAILGGLALWRMFGSSPRRAWTGVLAATVLLTIPTNLRFLLRDMEAFQTNRAQSGIQRTYLYAGEVAALEWIRDHAPAGAPVQPLPWIRLAEGHAGFIDTTAAALAPGLTGHPVDAGHWGETPDFGSAMGKWLRFVLPTTADSLRDDLLRTTGVRYVLFTQKHDETNDPLTESALDQSLRNRAPAFLRRVDEASNADADVYEVTSIPR